LIKAIAIDDEPLALKIVESFCGKTEGISLLKTFTSQEEANRYLENYPVDLIFLDIQMPNEDGISFYRKVKQNTAVIFTTAYDSYAAEGFNVNAIDYLVKPYSFERFDRACAKARKVLQLPSLNEEDHLFLRADYQLHKIKLSDILFIQSDDDYIRIFFSNAKSKIFRFTLKDIISKLPERDFVRAHRSYVIRTDKIEKIGNKTVYVQNHELPLGSNYEEDLKRAIKGGIT
jgi:DNA-binding LytR/AlgR family response regulator